MEILIPVLIVSAIAVIAGLGLAIASKYLAVPVDEKQAKIREALPGANCGSCGYSGCDGYAEAIAKGEAEPNRCAPGGVATSSALSEILGIEVSSEERVAHVNCLGSFQNATEKFSYSGLDTCAAAAMLYGGPKDCKYGCIGLGDCAKQCQFGGITFENGVALINNNLCTGCGSCVTACPKGVISLIPKNAKVSVCCSNTDKGVAAMKVCSVSCIGCGKCVKTCTHDAIYVENFLAKIDTDNCIGCGDCIAACPRHCISPDYCKEA